MDRTALYAGSFDPVTNGHLNIIERAARMYDSLTVAVAVNPAKTGLFTVDERTAILREVTGHIPNVTVDCFSGLLADYVNSKGFTAVVRGLRDTADFENEFRMSQMNARLFTGGTETVLLITDPRYSFISSSIVKEVASLRGNVDDLVHPFVAACIRDRFSSR